MCDELRRRRGALVWIGAAGAAGAVLTFVAGRAWAGVLTGLGARG